MSWQVSLSRTCADEIGDRLTEELQRKLERSGVYVVEAWPSHLAYAPEIAGALLRRQPAAAIIASRQRIVEGAVGMVEMALARLEASAGDSAHRRGRATQCQRPDRSALARGRGASPPPAKAAESGRIVTSLDVRTQRYAP